MRCCIMELRGGQLSYLKRDIQDSCSALHSLRPCWTAFLNGLQAVRLEYLVAADSKKYKSGGAEPTTC